MGIYTKSTKHCKKCDTIKTIDNFSKDKFKPDGLQTQCKSCVNAYKEKNKEKLAAYKTEYNKNNRHKRKEYHEANKERVLAQQKEYRLSKKNISIKQDIVLDKKVDTLIQKQKKNAYQKYRKATDPLFKLKGNIRNLIGLSMNRNGYTKTSMTYEILGCSYEEFKVYIESKFLEGMSWDNRSEWHLDHIIPVSYGLTEEEILALNHHSNFQPLWAIDNLRKSNRYIG